MHHLQQDLDDSVLYVGTRCVITEQRKESEGKKSKPLEESNAQLQLHYKFLNVQPHTMFREGVIYTLNLITTFQKCPSGFPGDQLITAGGFGNFFGRTVQFVHFYPNHMFRDPM